MTIALLWFRQNLRLKDNPPLYFACEQADAVQAVYLYSNAPTYARPRGGASRWALHHALNSLSKQIESTFENQSLYVEKTDDLLASLLRLVEATGATAVYTEKRWEEGERLLEAKLKEALAQRGVELKCYNASLLQAASAGTKADGTPYLVFTPYWKAQVKGFQENLRPLLEVPKRMPAPKTPLPATSIETLELMPKIAWHTTMQAEWDLSEAGGQILLDRFLHQAISNYTDERNLPAVEGTSRLSPYLHFGVMSVTDVFKQAFALKQSALGASANTSIDTFLSELGWREFAHHLLYFHPQMPSKPLKASFEAFPWQANDALLTAWQRGQTGYPLVDAGMRELWSRGWMHNRVRMVVGSLLVKHFLQPWQAGEAWFWDTLIDADVASNAMGWQWISGCGADASPYFRVFNPIMQSQKFDCEGDYIRKWVPELAKLPTAHLHAPWELGKHELKSYGVVLGQSYPLPQVEHQLGRKRALAALASLKTP